MYHSKYGIQETTTSSKTGGLFVCSMGEDKEEAKGGDKLIAGPDNPGHGLITTKELE